MHITEEEIKNLKDFEKTLKIEFKNLDFLKNSLIHKSYLNELKVDSIESNERLEYLGDAVLELVVSSYLFFKYPNRPEGELTSFRAALVKTESLAETAAEMKYGNFVYMSKGEESTGGRTRPYILANTYEAVLGAIYLDQGYEIADEFVKRTLLPKLDNIVKYRLDIDSKSKLQNLSQESLRETPQYEVISENGPDHDKEFEVKAVIAGVGFGVGKGHSKQEAEQNAAEDTLGNWDKLKEKYSKNAN